MEQREHCRQQRQDLAEAKSAAAAASKAADGAEQRQKEVQGKDALARRILGNQAGALNAVANALQVCSCHMCLRTGQSAFSLAGITIHRSAYPAAVPFCCPCSCVFFNQLIKGPMDGTFCTAETMLYTFAGGLPHL